MQWNIGYYLSERSRKTEILHDYAVDARITRFGGKFKRLLHLVIGYERIQRQVYIDAARMCIQQFLAKRIRIEVIGIFPGVEGSASQVNRIGSVFHRCMQRVAVSGGRKELYPSIVSV
jgi:hypothetical protein